MPLVNVQIIENVFTPEQKQQMITKITDTMVAIEGEALRGVTWVKIDEVKEGNWGVGGHSLHASDVRRMQEAGA
jgi:4-oxalocrotonate tautomerase